MSVAPKFVSSGLMRFFILLYIICITDAELSNYGMGTTSRIPNDAMLVVPLPELPLPANMPQYHRHPRKHLSPHSAPSIVLAPAHAPYYPRSTSAHSPGSSQLSKPSMKESAVAPATRLLGIAPTHSVTGAVPAALQPPLSNSPNCCKQNMVRKQASQGCHCVYPIKLDLLLLNVSHSPNWNVFLEELASQLGLRGSQIMIINFHVLSLSQLNISMDIIPHIGISFPAEAASKINNSLAMHRILLNPTLVGDYKLLKFTWFKSPTLSHAPLSAGSNVEAPPHQSSYSTNHSNLIIIIGIAVGVLIIAVVSVLITCLCNSNECKTKPSPDVTAKQKPVGSTTAATGMRSLPHLSSTRFIAYEELKEATNNFESASILGEGGFGRVFKGVLSDGTAVAIKRLNSGGHQGDKEFLCEVEMLSRLHHRNLVKLVGYYTSRDPVHNLLCYELMRNGSLEAWLHGPLGVNCPLDWDTRMKIALDAARGLAYLHEDSQPCVIHRDFKASNILLEKDFHAKVSDFGLAKLAPLGRENYLSTRVMGTFGYVAPEYAMTGHLLVKSDVYSYGVVLLELLTGRKPVEMSQPSGQENLVTWARPILRDKDHLEKLADPKIEGKYPKEDFIRVCTIAAACVASEANQRPSMGEVVQSLKMVQQVVEHQDSTVISSHIRPNLKRSSTTFGSDGASSMFSSGPQSGLSGFDNENFSRNAIFSEDLHEGR